MVAKASIIQARVSLNSMYALRRLRVQSLEFSIWGFHQGLSLQNVKCKCSSAHGSVWVPFRNPRAVLQLQGGKHTLRRPLGLELGPPENSEPHQDPQGFEKMKPRKQTCHLGIAFLDPLGGPCLTNSCVKAFVGLTRQCTYWS